MMLMIGEEKRQILDSVIPYMSNHFEVRNWLESQKDLEIDDLIRELEKKVDGTDGTLKTDFKILLNKMREVFSG
jgi:hypothetical protein